MVKFLASRPVGIKELPEDDVLRHRNM